MVVLLLIAAINGSPNRDGNTALLLREALSAAGAQGAETRLIKAAEVLADLDLPFCDNCSAPARCLLRGDRLGEALSY